MQGRVWRMNSKVYTVSELRECLSPLFSTLPVYKAVLFGSYAKGNATNQSDVDIVIDSHGELVNINFYGVLEDITQLLKKEIDLFEVSEIDSSSPIYQQISTEGIILYDRHG